MCWYYCIIGLVFCGMLPSFAEYDEKLRRYLHILYFPCVLFALAMFIGLRASSPDYGSYSAWFESIASANIVAQDWAEGPGLLPGLLHRLRAKDKFCRRHAVLRRCCISSLQLCFARLVCEHRWITLLFFLIVCRTFVGSDMASIRSAVAIPLMSCGIVLAFRGKKKTALLLDLTVFSFHLSVLIGLFPFVLCMLNVRFRSRWWVLSMATAAAIAEICLQSLVEASLGVTAGHPFTWMSRAYCMGHREPTWPTSRRARSCWQSHCGSSGTAFHPRAGWCFSVLLSASSFGFSLYYRQRIKLARVRHLRPLRHGRSSSPAAIIERKRARFVFRRGRRPGDKPS